MVTDDLNGVFVRSYGTVRSKSPELAADGTFRGGGDPILDGKRCIGHIINYTDGELVLWFRKLEVVEN